MKLEQKREGESGGTEDKTCNQMEKVLSEWKGRSGEWCRNGKEGCNKGRKRDEGYAETSVQMRDYEGKK